MQFHRAIVVGGSISGLLAAKVLARKFDEVLVLEADLLPKYPENRKGVPQSPQPHILFSKGYRIIENLLPGIGNDLIQAGAIPVDWAKEFSLYSGDYGWNATSKEFSNLVSYTCSRTLLELCIRNKIKYDDKIRIIELNKVVGLEYNSVINKIFGVKVKKIKTKVIESIKSDLVIDASGRGSKLFRWLDDLGIDIPNETIVNPLLGYATCRFQVPEGHDLKWKVMLISHSPPSYNRLGYVARIEHNEIIATLGGYGRDYPSADISDFYEYASALPSPEFFDVINLCKQISPVYLYRHTVNVMRHYERILMPHGLVVIGDSYCSLNPAYGQGITSSALGVNELNKWLDLYSSQSRINISPNIFQKQLEKSVLPQWNLCVNQDLGFESTFCSDPILLKKTRKSSKFPLNIIYKYVNALLSGSTKDPRLNYVLVEVSHLVKPLSAFFRPKIVFLVLKSYLGAYPKNQC